MTVNLPSSLPAVALLLVSYLLGSIPFGVILEKFLGGADVRKAGSGNIGATNVARVAGPAAGVLTLLLDGAKGWFAVWLAARFMHGETGFLVAAGFFALLGHCFPLWLRFRGGKGVAPAAGAFAPLSPEPILPPLLLLPLPPPLLLYPPLPSLAP